MRRTLIAPLLLTAGILLTACNSSTSAPRTVTFTNTVTGGSAASGSGAGVTGSSVVVVPPGGSAGSTAATAKTTPKTTAPPRTTAPRTPAPRTTTQTAAPFQKVDPLTVDCALLLTQADVKKAIGATIPNGAIRLRDMADKDRGVTGKIRCKYGSPDGGKTSKMTVILTKYGSAAAAASQIGRTKITEQDKGAKSSAATVRGYPAQILLRDGGLITMQYDTWTMSIVAANGLVADNRLAGGLPILAEQVLARVLKNG